ncbi:DNA polymerase I [Allofournierella massiliensis]|uniref:DNA polymerase I n=1 Tax=Allofournierella massiliensis TaxID=1650663 RepID=A0ABT7UP86_9FIRM|nr:DNA polymerase I [Fournierella massiliensis]MDM8200712.1 DNA polymerase I [Fournierella massiliensis]
MKLLVLDGNSIVNRAFYGIKLLTTKDGRYTNAIYGFMNILLNLLKEVQPDEVAIAFDLKAPTFRHKMYDGYKATRKGMPEELAQQMPVLKELLADLGFVMVSKEGYEADDILGTLSAAAAARGDECYLATGDRDSLQLVNDHVTVLLAATRMGRSETVVMDKAAVEEKYGVSPKQLIEVKSLMGDTSDNIPGVAGVGEKTALALIQKFGSLAGVYENIDDSAIKPGVRTKLTTHKEDAELSRKLAEIDCAIPVDTAPGTYKRGEGDAAAAAGLLAELEIHSLAPRLGLDGVTPKAAAPAPELAAVEPDVLPMIPEGRYDLAQEGEGWYAVQENAVYPLDEAALVRLLDSGATLRVFDAKPLYHLALAGGGEGESIVFDAKLAAYLLNPAASSYTVENLTAEYGIQPAFRCEAAPLAGVLAGLYDALDAKVTEVGMDRLLAEVELPLALVLADMERTGMLVDKEGLVAFGEKMKQELEGCLARIYEQVGYEFNVNSPKQLGEALFVKLGLPPRKKTKSGYSTNAETLESLRSEHPVIDDILQYRTYQKLNSTYVEGLLKVIGPDGRMHSTFNQTEARTGRLSSSEPNMQNIPIRTPLGSQLRQFFVAKPGCTLVDADYSQIELRLLAHISGDESMRQAFLTGQDIHRSTAAKIYNLPPEMITPALRSSAKAVNFGIVYGIGAFSLSRDINVSVKEADQFIKNYLATFPGVKNYMDETIAHGTEKGYVTTLFGRRRALPELASKNHNLRALGERMAMNTPIQGTAADVIKLAMVKVWRRLRAEGLAAKLILQVHDELIVEAPEAEAETVARILKEEMEGAVSYSVPLTADVGQGKTWLESH